MSSRRSVRQLLVAVLLGVLVGGGLMAVTPAGAEVSNAVATNWKKIWKKNLKPLADKRYYTKAQSDTKYSTKAEVAAGDAASNAATDTKLGGYYKKAEVDALVAPFVNSVAATSSGSGGVALTPATQVVRSVSLMPPADGTVIVSAAGSVATSVAGITRCFIGQGTALGPDPLRLSETEQTEWADITDTRGFTVTKGNLLTVNFVCHELSGESTVYNSSMTAIFAKTAG